MKIILVFLASYCVTSSQANIFILPNVTKCDLHLWFQNLTHTVLLDLNEDLDTDLKTCLIKECYPYQSLHLINGPYFQDHDAQIRVKLTNIPNVIIMTKHLTDYLLIYPSLKTIINSHWSLMYFVVTDETRYKCENGSLNGKVVSNLDIFLNKLWHKYRIARVCIAFVACKQNFVVYSGKRQTRRNLYDRRFKFINVSNVGELAEALFNRNDTLSEHYPLRSSIFSRFPTSITECSTLRYYLKFNLNFSEGHCGMDGLVMHDIVKHFRFKLSVSKDINCHKYGYVDSGEVIGSLGCIVRKEIDISFNSRFMTMYSSDYINFLHYVGTDSLCALTKQVENVPLWHYAYDVYRIELWLLILAISSIMGVVTWLLKLAKRNLTGGKLHPLVIYILESMISSFFGILIIKDRKGLLLRGTGLLCSVLFLAVYQGHVNHVFTTLTRNPNIKTLDELYDSGATLHTSPTMRDLLRQIANPNDEVEENFINQSKLLPGSRIGYILQHPNTVTLGRKLDTLLEIKLFYTDEYGRPMIHIVDECFHAYYLSYIARTGFPFIEDLQLFMERLKQAGLPKVYYRWTRRALGLADSVNMYRSEARPFQKITLGDQRIAFSLLMLGYVLSTGALIVELRRARYRS